jgi:acetolactate synthase-1/2/3 large subunit
MNGAESLMRTAASAGIEVCFANPGTTEMPLVTALDTVSGVRAVLGLFEGVCTGAADGYGRMADRPALTLLHLGPGFANGIANLHNARRARSPIVNLIGDQPTWHLEFDAPLTSDIQSQSLAAPVSAWVRAAKSSRELSSDVAEAIAVALRPPGRVTTLIVPVDCQWGEAEAPAARRPVDRPEPFRDDAVDGARRALSESGPGVLLLGGWALRARGLRAAGRIAAATGCRLVCETFPARLERGAGLPAVERLPYFPEQVTESLRGASTLVLAGAVEPVAFFGYPNVPSRLTPSDCAIEVLAHPEQDVPAALEALADALDAAPDAGEFASTQRPPEPRGALSPSSVGAVLARSQPEGAIVVDEAATSGMPYFLSAGATPPHTYLSLTGGAIGQGLPCATGAAIACPDRPVIALQADGSGMYTLQSLWTQAREGLDVTTLLCANRRYRILQIELARAGVAELGPQARALTDLSRPDIDWVRLAEAQGVPAARPESPEEFTRELERALREPGPHLIELLL